MPGAFHGIDLASRALRSFQRALDVTGHNIANVNTDGYSRQSIEFGTSDPTMFWANRAHMLGNGMNISAVSRIRDAFLESRRLAAESDMGRLGTLASALRQVEGLFLEPGESGIASALDAFFNAWSGLASNPNEPAMRSQVQSAGATLARRVREAWANMEAERTGQEAAIESSFDEIDRLTSQIAALNREIRAQSSLGAIPNDMLDAQDAALRELGALVDIHVARAPDGTVSVTMNERLLVDVAGSIPIARTYDAATMKLSDANGSYSVRSGSLAGQFQSMNAISSYQSRLDTLADEIASNVNAIHSTGINLLGNTGVAFFAVSVPPTGARGFALDPAVAADPRAIVSGASGNPGDGGLALSLSNLRDADIAGLGNTSFGGYYASLVSDVGNDVAGYRSRLDTQDAVSAQIDAQIQSISGVSIDDEMANMLRFQRSYQAAARTLTLFDQVTEDLINMLRR